MRLVILASALLWSGVAWAAQTVPPFALSIDPSVVDAGKPTEPLSPGVHIFSYDFSQISGEHFTTDIMIKTGKGSDWTPKDGSIYPSIGCDTPFTTLRIDALGKDRLRFECSK